MSIRKKLVLFSLALLTIPLGVIYILIRILYYQMQWNGDHLSDTAPSAVTRILAEHYAVFMLVLILMSVVAVVITGIVFLRGLLRPLQQLRMAAAQIEAGNLDFAVSYNRQDEFLAVFTQFDRMRARLKDSLWQQVEDERTRIDLLTNIAHDLKTPITSIQGYAQGLLDGVAQTEEKKEKYLQTIIMKSNVLSRLSETLYDYVRMGRNEINLDQKRVSAQGFIEEELSEVAMGNPEIRMRWQCDVSQTTVISIDIPQFRRVIANIIQNSEKYKMGEKAEVLVNAYENQHSVICCFADKGVGVGENELEKIFNRFYRSDAARQNTATGSGLGLSIAKQIVEAHGGHIWARKNDGQGLRVFISVPKDI